MIERYAGPGEFCPECGERLSPHAANGSATSQPDAEPAAAPPPKKRGRARTLVLAAAALIVICAAALVFGGTPFVPALSVRVCSSTMTDRLARRVTDAYIAHHTVWPYRFTITAPGNAPCDVRFYSQPPGPPAARLARDGVVVVVNPQNGITRLTTDQARDVLAGRITDWSQLGGAPGAVAVAVPDDLSDEAQALDARVMGGRHFGPLVVRTMSGMQIARWVASPSGTRGLGVLPFSVALPAKVVALGDAPAPSLLSVSDARYPLTTDLVVASDFRSPSRPAAALLAFATSSEANDAIAGVVLVRKNGL